MGGLVSLFGPESSTVNGVERFLPQNGEEVIIFNIKLGENSNGDNSIPKIVSLTE